MRSLNQGKVLGFPLSPYSDLSRPLSPGSSDWLSSLQPHPLLSSFLTAPPAGPSNFPLNYYWRKVRQAGEHLEFMFRSWSWTRIRTKGKSFYGFLKSHLISPYKERGDGEPIRSKAGRNPGRERRGSPLFNFWILSPPPPHALLSTLIWFRRQQGTRLSLLSPQPVTFLSLSLSHKKKMKFNF